MKKLIVYYSFTSNNELLALQIQKYLSCDIIKIEERKRRNAFTFFIEMIFNHKPSIIYPVTLFSKYDHVLLIAPVWAGKIASPLKAFLRKEHKSIKRYSFISVCGGRAGQRARIERELTTLMLNPPQNILELWISKLIPKNKTDVVKAITLYRITPADIEFYEPDFEPFLKSLELQECE